jgi:DNA-binding protein YbaB
MGRIDAQITSARDNAIKMAAVVGRGESEDGRVIVTVNATGSLQSIEFDPKAMRLASTDLADAIVATARLAEQDAKTQVRAIWGKTDLGGVDIADAAQGQADLVAEVDRRLAAAREAMRKTR